MNYGRPFRLLILLVVGMIAGTFFYKYSLEHSKVYMGRQAFYKSSQQGQGQGQPRPVLDSHVHEMGVIQMGQSEEKGPLVGAIRSEAEKKDMRMNIEPQKQKEKQKFTKTVSSTTTAKTTTKKPDTTTKAREPPPTTTNKSTTSIKTSTLKTSTSKTSTSVKTTTPGPKTSNTTPATDDDKLPVPRIVHYAWYSKTKLVFRFHHFISVLSAYKFVRPKKIMMWYEIEPKGPWWMEIRNRVPVLELKYRKAPTEIFGKPVHVAEHQSDIVRLEAVMQYGGVYTDLDVIITKSLDPLRKYNTTMGYETPGGLCNGIIISAPNAPYLKIWHESYKTFNDAQWAYHSVQLPATLAKQNPKLIHTESDTLHRPNWIEKDWLYKEGKIWDWSKNYAVHLWYRFHNVDHNPEDIKTLDTTMGQLFRYIYYGKKDIIK